MTLTELSYYSRRFAPFALLFFLILLIIYYLIRLLLLTITPPGPPTVYLNPVFGKIKKPAALDKAEKAQKEMLKQAQGKTESPSYLG